MTSRRQFIKAATASVLSAASLRAAYAAQAAAAPARRGRDLVQTVLGPVPASKLGFTLPHEHLFASSAGFLQQWPEYFGGRKSFIDKVSDKLKEVKDGGVDTIVDVTPFDVGRDIRFMEEVSRKSGMQIVVATGHWLFPSLSMGARSIEELTDLFVMEIERGIEGTDIKAGVIKVATNQELTPFLEKVLRAAARARKLTTTPIVAHSYAPARIGETQAKIFEEEGLEPAAVCIGHSDDTDNLEYLKGLAGRGYALGMDHFTHGIDVPPPRLSWQSRLNCVKQLIEAGFANRILLSNDWYFASSLDGSGAAHTVESMNRKNPDGMLFLIRKGIPYLKEIGVSEQAVHTMTVENPRRFLAG